MKKILSALILLGAFMFFNPASAQATQGHDRGVKARSVGASLCSLLVWPGIGQAINGQKIDKNVTHAVLGLTGVFRLWSFYDAIVDRDGGVWHNRI